MKNYDHKKIEKKWQTFWDKKAIYKANNSKKKKFFGLIEFPYPSGAGMHVGHIRSNTAMDIISRKRRMEGYNVLYPIGWDAFGLPTENYAIKTGKKPASVTKKNTDIFRKQLKEVGFSFDWSREINTTDPKYYKWTQWIFLQFLKKGLAYKAKMTINWCPKDKTGLANEEVIAGCCERCGTQIEKKEKEQWMLAITKYADRLDKDLDTVDYLPQIKLSQRNWIGRSEGAEIDFTCKSFFDSYSPRTAEPNSSFKKTEGGFANSHSVKIFTTRPDTIFGATYLVLAPEHDLVEKLKNEITNLKEVEEYINKVKNKTDIERTAEDKTKTGVELKGIKAINPANKEEIPVWIADYVLPHYGTGAIMAVPAHDERDFEFAKKYNLGIRQVIMPDRPDEKNLPRPNKENTEREIVHVILRNKKEKTILVEFLKGEVWGENKPVNFIIGGIENGESDIEAATREVREETGYTNIKFVQKIPYEIQSRFFAAHKDVNRVVHVHTLVFDLVDEEREEISEEEKKLHDLKWIKEEEVADTITISDDKATWEYFCKGGFALSENGIIINSNQFNGLDSEKAKKEIIKFVGGKEKVTFKLRDWLFSRQRYWGEPIPVVHCEKCGTVPLPEKSLPLLLPEVKNYQPTDNGESPLANITKWINTKCPKCKGFAKRETDTMPNWAGSSWYYLRYTDPKNNKEFASKKNLKYWSQVDWYNGGNEHTTLHLLYSRFWHKFLYDLKLVPTAEPYKKRTSHGMILAADGTKFSKSKGNGVSPEDIIKIYGADSLRLYEMFMGPFDQAVSWSSDGIVGPRRFVERVWRIGEKVSAQKNLPALPASGLRHGSNFSVQKLLHKTIKKVSEDIENMSFNTAISTMMILANEMDKSEVGIKDYKKFLQILNPFAPHISEELWFSLGEKKSINLSTWPKYDENLIKDEEIKIVIQINGKVRAEIMVNVNNSEEEIQEQAISNETISKYLTNNIIKKVIYVKGRLINIVI